MSAEALEQHTYLPEDKVEELAGLASFLEAHHTQSGDVPKRRYMLVGAVEGDQVELPEAVHAALLQVVEAMKAGRAVTVAPRSTVLTTQQAADLLGVSRPTVVRLIDSGELPADRVGNRRRVLLRELLAYRERRRQRQHDAIFDTSVDVDADEDPAAVVEQLKLIRKSVAARRHKLR